VRFRARGQRAAFDLAAEMREVSRGCERAGASEFSDWYNNHAASLEDAAPGQLGLAVEKKCLIIALQAPSCISTRVGTNRDPHLVISSHTLAIVSLCVNARLFYVAAGVME
jgi:hypothetical protein